jgi:hypothetical protein
MFFSQFRQGKYHHPLRANLACTLMHKSSPSPSRRVSAIAALVGVLLLFMGTFLHPSSANPTDAIAAFTEYAADRLWVSSHLMQLLGCLSIGASLVLFSQTLMAGAVAVWARLGMAGAIASMAMFSALQAVDGVALKVMVDRWSPAAEPEKAMLFQVAFGVRQIEIGLASTSSLLFGLTMSIYGMAILSDRQFPRWLGAIAILGSTFTIGGGIVYAYSGFSNLGMWLTMPGSILFMLWLIGLGLQQWQQSRSSL